MTQSQQWLTIEREFAAPIERVWAMWTEPDLFARWYGPKGMQVSVEAMEFTIGGTRKICMEMKTPEREMRMWFIGVYKQINAPNRLVYTESMCEEDGTLIPPQAMGMPDDFPDITEVIVDLSQTADGTRMVMRHIGVAAGTAGEGGWNQAFDKLADFLTTLS